MASSLFCADRIDPSVVHFATIRLAVHWGRDEEEIDLMITGRLFRAVGDLITELDPDLAA